MPFARLIALLALTLALAACSSSPSAPATPTITAVPATATVAAPTPTPTPDPAVLLRDGGIAIIERAYDRLLDQYIEPADPAALLRAAWEGASREASARGIEVPDAPGLTGERAADIGAFRVAWKQLAGVAAADATPIRHAAIRSMAESLADCHTFFLSPVASTTIEDQREGKGTVGIGVELAGVPPLVTEVIDGGPAAKAGVLVGDRIVAVDGTNTSGLGPAGAFELINGDEGTAVRVRIRRSGTGDLDLTMTRARVAPPIVAQRVIEGTGYVRIRNFVDGGVSGPLRQALEGFEAQGVTRWIIDLRDNPGGRLDPEAISLFVKDGVIVRNRDRSGAVEETRATGQRLATLRPLVLLTDNRTGSVAEVFAAALKEYGVAYVLGTTTNGCVGYTDIQPLGDGSSLAVTTHVNLGPVSSEPLNGAGVVPDETVNRTTADIAAGRDPQLDAALAHLAP